VPDFGQNSQEMIKNGQKGPKSAGRVFIATVLSLTPRSNAIPSQLIKTHISFLCEGLPKMGSEGWSVQQAKLLNA
jgi:hypothetical protein